MFLFYIFCNFASTNEFKKTNFLLVAKTNMMDRLLMMAVLGALIMTVGTSDVLAAKKKAKRAKTEQQAVWPDGTPMED